MGFVYLSGSQSPVATQMRVAAGGGGGGGRGGGGGGGCGGV